MRNRNVSHHSYFMFYHYALYCDVHRLAVFGDESEARLRCYIRHMSERRRYEVLRSIFAAYRTAYQR